MNQSLDGVVVQTRGGVYRVAPDGGSAHVDAAIRGRLKREDRAGQRVVIGDRARVAPVEGGWAIEEILPRRNVILRRGGTASRPKAIIANVDRVFVVAAAERPELDLHRIDRFLVIAAASDVPALILVNKCDLPAGADRLREVASVYEPLGYRVLGTSAETGVGLDELRELLAEGVAVFLGASGTGKTSILNALDPDLELRTGDLSRKLGRGRHTTVNARLIDLKSGGRVGDTPGFEHAGPWGVDPGELDRCFPEMVERRDQCRFRGCAHVSEPDCAVREAIESGEIAETRIVSYNRIRDELEAEALS